MKLSKFLACISLVTFFSVLYVYQQTEILRLAYTGQKRIAVFEDLLDKNSILRYNISRSASLVHIGNIISKSNDFQIPDTYRLVRLTSSPRSLTLGRQTLKRLNLVSLLFGVKRQAEAKTINP